MPVAISSEVPPVWFLKKQINQLRRYNKQVLAKANRDISMAVWYKNNMVYNGELYSDPIIPPWDESLYPFKLL